MIWRRAAVAIALTISLGAVALSSTAASAHSVNDLLKVPVSKIATVLLPPLTTPRGPTELEVLTPPAFTLSDASAGVGWTSRVRPHAALLTGNGFAAALVVTLTGMATRPGAMALSVRISRGSAPGADTGAATGAATGADTGADTGAGQRTTMTYHFTLTALNGYLAQRGSPDAVDAASVATPDATLAFAPRGRPQRPWIFSGAMMVLAAAVLVSGGRSPVRRRVFGIVHSRRGQSGGGRTA